jgi:catechol 2,3-dioxygenase-like lactoylglutathione lyase family enzyme
VTPVLAYATLIVPDPARSAAFYRRALGWPEAPPSNRPDTFRRLELDGAGVAFSAPSIRELFEVPDAVSGFLTFDPGSAEAVASYAEALVVEGARVIQPAHETRYGSMRAILIDPDDNIVRLEHSLLPPN